MKKILYIGNKLSKHGYNKTSIETLGVFLESEGYEIYFSSSKKNPFVRLVDMVYSVIKKNKEIDFILIDTYSTSSFWYAFICGQIARLLKVKYICILRGGNLPIRLKNNPFLCKQLFNNAYKNIAPSNYLKSEFETRGFENITYIPNTIEINHYVFKERMNFTPKLLWVRAFASIYNPKMAIDVLLELRKTYPEASLTMVGPDKDGSLIETKEYAEIKNVSVKFTGKLSKEEWWKIGEEHDVFISTTHFDNTPISVMEAMALGLAVVSTNVGGIPYMLTNNENAILVDDDDALGMSESIVQLILNLDNNTEKLVSNARKNVETKDWKQVKEQWFSLLK